MFKMVFLDLLLANAAIGCFAFNFYLVNFFCSLSFKFCFDLDVTFWK